jgi:hypothetical protein
MTIEEVDKDEILNMKFPEEDVLKEDKKKTLRWLQLKSAANNWEPKSELDITFKSDRKGLLKISSRIVRTHSDYVILSGGYVLPMRSIQHVK